METNVSLQSTTWFEKQAIQFEGSRFGAMTIMMTIQSCIGSIAAMYGLKIDSLIILSLAAGFTMASNAAFISLAPAKWCLGIFYSSVIVNISLVLIALM